MTFSLKLPLPVTWIINAILERGNDQSHPPTDQPTEMTFDELQASTDHFKRDIGLLDGRPPRGK